MKHTLNIKIFAHSLVSDWNHGNAHFLRGLARALINMGHKVRCYEELGAWSLANLVKQEGESAIGAIDQFRRTYPELDVHFYKKDNLHDFLARELRHSDVVIIHEWNEPAVVNKVLEFKSLYGFKALLHDTHHRAYTRPGDILRFRLDRFDGVLAFGDAIRKIYSDAFGMRNVYVFHEAADVNTFKPLPKEKSIDVVWIGNWGDEERSKELEEFLIRPAAEHPERRTVVHGVRYPEHAVEKLQMAGIEYRGYLPNLEAPRVYSESVVSLHVPRQQYTNGLSGIPTIRVFEALSCGAPLLCSPWTDAENLFRPGEDYVIAKDGKEMAALIGEMMRDEQARRQIAENGMQTVRQRHSCEHRAEQLLHIVEELHA